MRRSTSVTTLIAVAHARAVSLLTENRKRLDDIVTQLLARETLDEIDVYAAAGIDHVPANPRAMAGKSAPGLISAEPPPR